MNIENFDLQLLQVGQPIECIFFKDLNIIIAQIEHKKAGQFVEVVRNQKS